MRKFKGYKMDESGMIQMEDGMPIGIFEENGKDVEAPLDAVRLFSTIDKLNKENKTRREEGESFKDIAEKFKILKDKNIEPEEAIKAIETLGSFDEKSLVNAEKVAEEKRELQVAHQKEIEEIKRTFSEEKTALEKNISASNKKLEKFVVSNHFSQSSFFNGENRKTILPPDIAEARFGSYFKVDENGNITGFYDDGHERIIQSRKNYGEPADFEEAIETLIEKYPGKDSILKTNFGGPGGNRSSNNGNGKVNPFAKETFNLTEQMKLTRENPEMAKALKNEAGIV